MSAFGPPLRPSIFDVKNDGRHLLWLFMAYAYSPLAVSKARMTTYIVQI